MKPTLKELYALGYSKKMARAILASLEVPLFILECND